ncbi:hypothetical protein Tco_1055843 [Tanacetum coccineum]|uniref:Uncharacterized protein n=1 Tax=Tanacetum coccineum TaxID=301880 RepID=A0ABQ5H0X0_9ASTR
MERGFLSLRRRGELGRGVKEKQHASVDDSAKEQNDVNMNDTTINVNVEPVSIATIATVASITQTRVGLANKSSLALIPTVIASTPESVSFATFLKQAKACLIRLWRTTLRILGVNMALLNEMMTNGTTLMLDSYKTNMCLGSWGGSSYARAMIKLRVEVELKDTQVVDIAKFKGERYTRSTIRIEYEYQPPRCLTCKLVLVDDDEKPLKKVDDLVNTNNDIEVEEVFSETRDFMASTSSKVDNNFKTSSGVRNKSIFEQWRDSYIEEAYDDNDFYDCGLTDDQMKFANTFDISIHGQLR